MILSNQANAPSRRRSGLAKGSAFICALAAMIGAGLVYLAVDYELNRPAAGLNRECTMPDGTVLVLRKVTFGKQHQLEVGRFAGRFPLLGGGGGQMASAGSAEDSMVFWLTRRDAVTGRAMDFDWWSHCVAVDDHGCEFVDENPGRTAFHSNGSIGDGGRPLRPLAGQSSENYDQIVVHSSLRPFRHAGPTFKLQVYNLERTMVAEFDVADPSPSRGQYAIWQPAALPATKNDRDLSVTLRKLSGTKAERYLGPESRADTIRLDAEFEITQNGKPATGWTRQNVKVLDALGNVGSLSDSHLCPREEAWKVQVRVFRDANARFDPSELWSVPGVAVPAAGNANRLNQAETIQGVTVELLATGGGGSVTHFGLTQTNYSGSWGYSGSVGAGATQFPCTFDTKTHQGTGSTTTVQCQLPHVVARVSGLTEDHYTPDLRVTDDQSRVVPVYGPTQHADATQFWFLLVPDDAKSLDLTFIVQKGRMVEFLVKPPLPEPLKMIKITPAPTDVAQ